MYQVVIEFCKTLDPPSVAQMALLAMAITIVYCSEEKRCNSSCCHTQWDESTELTVKQEKAFKRK